MVSMIWRTVCDKSFAVIYWIESSLSWVLSNCWFCHHLQWSKPKFCRAQPRWSPAEPPCVTCMMSSPGWGYSRTGNCSSMFMRPISSGSAPWLTRYTISWSKLVPGKERQNHLNWQEEQERWEQTCFKNKCPIWEKCVVGLGILIN